MTNEELSLEAQKIHAEIGKLIAETMKITAEGRWYPFVVGAGAGAGLLAAAVGFIKVLLH
jgi:predicted RNA methylase